MAKKRPTNGTEKEKMVVAEKDEVIRANIHREEVSSDKWVSLYVNDTQVQITPWDFRFIFGNIVGMPSPDNPSVKVSMIGEVRMSPQHAKRVALVLIKQLQNYESSVGPIPQPADENG